MFTAELTPDTPAWYAREFFRENRNYLSELYPDKWVVVLDKKVFFVADSAEEMFSKAQSLGMSRGTYFYKHILPAQFDSLQVDCQIDGIGI